MYYLLPVIVYYIKYSIVTLLHSKVDILYCNAIL